MSLIDEAVESVKSKAAQFTAAYNQLTSMKNIQKYPELYSRWKVLMNQAQTVRNTVSSITSAIDSGAKIVASALGGTSRDGLGFVQFLTLPVIYGAIAALTAFLTAVAYLYEDYKKAEAQSAANENMATKLIKQGVAPVDVAKIIAAQNQQSKSALQSLTDSLPLIMIGGALLIFLNRSK